MSHIGSEVDIEAAESQESNNVDQNEAEEQAQPASEDIEAAENNEPAIDEESGELSVEEQLAAAIGEQAACQDKMLRMAAELENYKKRMIRERDNVLKYAGESLIRDLLPTVDNLERALDHEPEGDVSAFMEGVDMTLKGLLATLEKAGLTPINSVGEPFDPNVHEALAMEASQDVPDQCVLREFEKGYHFKDRLLRAAKVVVSKGEA